MTKPVIEATNYSSIQTAVDAAAPGGCVVALAPGDHSITAPLALPQGVRLAAAGWRTTKLIAAAPMDAMIKIAGTAQLAVNGCCVDGIALDGAGKAAVGVDLAYARNGNILRNLYIENCGVGVRLQPGCWINHLSDVRVVRCGRGFELLSNANAVTLSHCQAEYCTGAGIWIEDSTNVRLFGVEVSGNGANGLDIHGGESYEVIGGYFEGNAGANINIDSGAGLDVVRSATLQSCYFSGTEISQYAVQADYCASLSILSCHSQRHTIATINAKSEAKRVTRLGLDTTDPIWIDGLGQELRNLDSLHIDQSGRFRAKASDVPTLHLMKVEGQTTPLLKMSDFDGTERSGIDKDGNLYTSVGRGLILTSPDGARFRLQVDNAGTLTAVKL